MSTGSTIPIATPVDDLHYDIKNIKKNIGKIIENIDKTNTALTGLNVFNIIALQTGVNDLGVQIAKFKVHNQNMDRLNGLITEFNTLLRPISNLAHDRIKASEIEARIKEKEFTLKMSEIRSKRENIPVWDAYQLNIKDEHSYLTFNYAIGVTVPIILGLTAVILTKSHL